MKKVFSYFVIGCLFMTVTAFAGMHDRYHHGPRGFGSEEIMSVGDIHAKAQDGQMVFMQGSLTKYFGGENYEFTDLSGNTIEVELDSDRDWSYLRKDEPIHVVGKLHRNMFSIKVDVKKAFPIGRN